ncbi:MAG TPA: hypothetical protein VLK22_03800 [Candidatus Udaeobacter sp.]|nr:hypothetical protein [Candidatus Udaeobacter sp.]
MTADLNQANTKSAQGVNAQLNDLLKDAKNLNREIDKTNSEANKNIDGIEAVVDRSVNKITRIYSDLDAIEENAGDELDKLVLQRTKDLADE